MPRVKVIWDTSDPSRQGWFATVEENGIVVCDSLKRGFPVRLGYFKKHESADVWAVLSAEFPNHRIDIFSPC